MTPWIKGRFICLSLFPIAMIALAGCGDSGPDVVPVSGTVTMDGQPLSGVQVEFTPQAPTEGSVSTGPSDASGKYELYYSADRKGAVEGKHKVRISRSEESTEAKIPARYNTQSELEANVTNGGGPYNFDIKSK